MRPSTSVTPRMPMFTPGSPGPGQQIFYGHAGPSIISPMVNYIFTVNLLFNIPRIEILFQFYVETKQFTWKA